MFGLATFLLETLAKGKDICYNNGGKKIFDRKLNQKEKTTKTVVLVVLVPKVGLEPTRYRYQRILSPSRLPVHHFGKAIKFQQLYYYIKKH